MKMVLLNILYYNTQTKTQFTCMSYNIKKNLKHNNNK